MHRWIIASLAVVFLAGCHGSSSTPVHRMTLDKVTADTFRVVPTQGQLPYCLVFTRAKSGTLRQLTMVTDNRSVKCPAGKPVLGLTFRAPVSEGPVKVLAFFSDKRINAGRITEVLSEKPNATALDFSLPGQVFVASDVFTPEKPSTPTTGKLLGEHAGAMTPAADAGSPVASAKMTKSDAGTPAAP